MRLFVLTLVVGMASSISTTRAVVHQLYKGCSNHANCSDCITDYEHSCGWCSAEGGKCLEGDKYGPYRRDGGGSCDPKSSWHWNSCPSGTPSPGATPHPMTPAPSASSHCSSYMAGCDACVSAASGDCGWCSSTYTCAQGTNQGPSNGQCPGARSTWHWTRGSCAAAPTTTPTPIPMTTRTPVTTTSAPGPAEAWTPVPMPSYTNYFASWKTFSNSTGGYIDMQLNVTGNFWAGFGFAPNDAGISPEPMKGHLTICYAHGQDHPTCLDRDSASHGLGTATSFSEVLSFSSIGDNVLIVVRVPISVVAASAFGPGVATRSIFAQGLWDPSQSPPPQQHTVPNPVHPHIVYKPQPADNNWRRI